MLITVYQVDINALDVEASAKRAVVNPSTIENAESVDVCGVDCTTIKLRNGREMTVLGDPSQLMGY